MPEAIIGLDEMARYYESLQVFRNADAVCVLGSALRAKESLAKPLPSNFIETGFTPELTDITRERLEAAIYVTDVNPRITLVTCGRNPNNYFQSSDATVMAETAQRDYRVSNPVITLDLPFTTITETLEITRLGSQQSWKSLILVTNRPYVVRTMVMMRDMLQISDVVSRLTVLEYLDRLSYQFPDRNDAIAAFYSSVDYLKNNPYAGSYTIITPVNDVQRFGDILITDQESQGTRDWVAQRYGL